MIAPALALAIPGIEKHKKCRREPTTRPGSGINRRAAGLARGMSESAFFAVVDSRGAPIAFARREYAREFASRYMFDCHLEHYTSTEIEVDPSKGDVTHVRDDDGDLVSIPEPEQPAPSDTWTCWANVGAVAWIIEGAEPGVVGPMMAFGERPKWRRPGVVEVARGADTRSSKLFTQIVSVMRGE